MQKSTITMRQAYCMIILFTIGSSLATGVNPISEQDSWISLLLAAAAAIPFVMMYARIIRLYPEKNFFEILEIVFGKIGGKIVILLMTWYAIHLGAMVDQNYSQFFQSMIMPETPQMPVMAMMILIAAYLAKSDIETMGKWALVVLPIVSFIVFLTIVFSLKDMRFINLFPVGDHSAGIIAMDTFETFSYPFVETVIFLGVADGFKKEDSPYKLYFWSILITCFIFLLVMIRNIALLGGTLMSDELYPSYAAERIVIIGNFLSRIEGTIAINKIFCIITKVALCLMAAARGISKLFEIKNYKTMVMPVSLFCLALCSILYNSVSNKVLIFKVYPFYAFPFQILIPLVVWITAEVKARKQKNAAQNQNVSTP